MELISIVDCDLCVALPSDQHIPEWELPLPETWGRLSTILGRRDWDERWSTDLAHYASALEFEEIRVCRACGTHYHYRQIHDHHSGEPRPSETEWYLSRLTPTGARDYYLDPTSPNGVVEHLDDEWPDQGYKTIIGLLRRDLSRAPDWQIERYIVDSLYVHYVDVQDWEGLRSTLLDYPDPAVSVYVADRIFLALDPENPARRLTSSSKYWDNLSALLAAEPTRKPFLVAALAGGLSAPGQIMKFFRYPPRWEPVSVAGYAMNTFRTSVPRQSLAPAVGALAAALQKPDSTPWWREAARDLLIKYVGAARKRAKEVLKTLAGDTDEALAVRTHCQECLTQSAS
jgi:hypothetical protein